MILEYRRIKELKNLIKIKEFLYRENLEGKLTEFAKIRWDKCEEINYRICYQNPEYEI